MSYSSESCGSCARTIMPVKEFVSERNCAPNGTSGVNSSKYFSSNCTSRGKMQQLREGWRSMAVKYCQAVFKLIITISRLLLLSQVEILQTARALCNYVSCYAFLSKVESPRGVKASAEPVNCASLLSGGVRLLTTGVSWWREGNTGILMAMGVLNVPTHYCGGQCAKEQDSRVQGHSFMENRVSLE